METEDRGQRDGSDRGEDAALLAALRAGDERAFARLVARHLLRGLDAFEGRSSLRTYLFRIVMNLARTRAVREARSALSRGTTRRDLRSIPSASCRRRLRGRATAHLWLPGLHALRRADAHHDCRDRQGHG
jgi:hypothetical protein